MYIIILRRGDLNENNACDKSKTKYIQNNWAD